MKKNGETFTAKIKAIGSEEHIEECLIQLSMACHNLLPHQEPSMQFSIQRTIMLPPETNFREEMVAINHQFVEELSSAPTNLAIAYDGTSNNQAKKLHIGPTTVNAVCDPQNLQHTQEQNMKRKGLFHPSDIEPAEKYTKVQDNVFPMAESPGNADAPQTLFNVSG